METLTVCLRHFPAPSHWTRGGGGLLTSSSQQPDDFLCLSKFCLLDDLSSVVSVSRRGFTFFSFSCNCQTQQAENPRMFSSCALVTFFQNKSFPASAGNTGTFKDSSTLRAAGALVPSSLLLRAPTGSRVTSRWLDGDVQDEQRRT